MSRLIYDKVQKMTVALLVAITILCQCITALASSVSNVQVSPAPMDPAVINKDGMVRVYLSSLNNPELLELELKGNYILSHNNEVLSSGTKIKVSFSSTTGKISLAYNGKNINGLQQVVFRRTAEASGNGIYIAQSRDSLNPYPGDMSFESVFSNGAYTLYPVVHVFIEDYLYGVLPYEMGNSSDMEALKAQAVAARTYTVRMMQARAGGRYDVKDTTSDQVYRGTPSGNANCRAAVDSTKGIVLMYGSNYITTFYSSSNGGQTEVSRTGTQYPYMKVKDDPFDYANGASVVKSKTVYADLNHHSNPYDLIVLLRERAVRSLQRAGYNATYENTLLQRLINISVHTPMYSAPSRLYTKIDFEYTVSTQTSSGHSRVVSLKETFDIFSELENLLGMGIQSSKNELWSVEKTEERFVLQARRYGHGMGMSQRGAMYMAKLGYSYDEILGFYYEGSKLVEHRFSSHVLHGPTVDHNPSINEPSNSVDKCQGVILANGGYTPIAMLAGAYDGAPAIGYIESGEQVCVYTNTGLWSQIQYGELIGFIPSAALAVNGVPTNVSQETTDILGFATVKANDYVNLRQNGSMNAKIVGKAPAGAKMTVLENHGSWAKIQYKATVAYVNTSYILFDFFSDEDVTFENRLAVVYTESGKGAVNLRKSMSLSAQIIGCIPSGTTVTVNADHGEWCKISTTSGNGYMMSKYLKNPDEVSSAPTHDPLNAIVSTQQGPLNLREKNQSTSRILTVIPRGEVVRVNTKGEIWCAVEYGQYRGYVMTRFLSFENSKEDNMQLPSYGTNEFSSATVTTPSGTLNLREYPNTNARILMQLSPGTVVDVVETNSDWTSIIHQHLRGYVMSRYLRFGGANENAPNDGEDYLAPEEDVQTAFVRTQSGGLNLRKLPSIDSVVLTIIPQNASVNVITYGDEWCFVNVGRYSGFVMTRFLEFEESPALDYRNEPTDFYENMPHKWVNTESGRLNLRRKPDINSEVLVTIPRFTLLDILAEGEEWCYVAYGTYEGYVMTRYLADDNPVYVPAP